MTTTEIATADHSAALARVATRSAIELTADQQSFTPTQVAALKQLGIEDAPAAQLDLFFHRCQLTRLDPFSKQIYLIGRKTKTGGYRGEPERWETKYTIQTGIDGYRLNGHRAAADRGESVKTEGPFWQGKDGGGWNDVWLGGRGNPPAAAKFVIIADGEPHVGIAMYDEFVQTKANGDPNSMWSKMPANQLAKCAEAQAWRKAYPDDFSGLVLEDAAQIIDPDGSPVDPIRATTERVSATTALAGGRQAIGAAPTVVDAPTADQGPEMATTPEQRRLSAQLDRHGRRDAGDKLGWLAKRLGRDIASAAELTGTEAREATEYLAGRRPGELDEDQAASNDGAKPDTAQVEEPPKASRSRSRKTGDPVASPAAKQWEQAKALLAQLECTEEDDQLDFVRRYFKSESPIDPLTLTVEQADELVTELTIMRDRADGPAADEAAKGGADQ